MNRRSLLAVVVSAALAGGLPSCSAPDLTGPPVIRAGRDLCSECGMIINEDRCSCALLVVREGVREHLLFDDIGCLLNTRETAEDLVVLEGFVRDHGTGAWVAFDQAAFLMADREKLPTPMGSGIVAFADAESAERLRAAVGGEVLDADRIQPAHVAWLEANFGKRTNR